MGAAGHLTIEATMSALGQKQTSDSRLLMSALPPKADIRPRSLGRSFCIDHLTADDPCGRLVALRQVDHIAGFELDPDIHRHRRVRRRFQAGARIDHSVTAPRCSY